MGRVSLNSESRSMARSVGACPWVESVGRLDEPVLDAHSELGTCRRGRLEAERLARANLGAMGGRRRDAGLNPVPLARANLGAMGGRRRDAGLNPVPLARANRHGTGAREHVRQVGEQGCQQILTIVLVEGNWPSWLGNTISAET